MKTFQTSTQIAPIVSVGTYWGWFEYDRLWGYQEESDREEGRFVCNDYSHEKLGEAIVTILDLDEAEEKYHGVKELLALPDKGRRELAESLRKYLESDVPEAAKKRAQEEVDGRAKWLTKFEDDVRDAVEQNHPNENAVEHELYELRRKWTDMFGEDGNAKVRDLPRQMLLGGGLS